ncbi:hypothetical protein E4U52_008333, partial [Claviceps spartinae]
MNAAAHGTVLDGPCLVNRVESPDMSPASSVAGGGGVGGGAGLLIIDFDVKF